MIITTGKENHHTIL